MGMEEAGEERGSVVNNGLEVGEGGLPCRGFAGWVMWETWVDSFGVEVMICGLAVLQQDAGLFHLGWIYMGTDMREAEANIIQEVVEQGRFAG